MPARLVALDEGSDIPLDRAMIVVGRHPQCDARLDSLRVSRHHCCMTQDQGEVVVRDLGSTNGIRINGQRVEFGRVRPGDELSIAHIRYRLDNNQGHEVTLPGDPRDPRDPRPDYGRLRETSPTPVGPSSGVGPYGKAYIPAKVLPRAQAIPSDQTLAAAVREKLPSDLANRCRIEVIVHLPGEDDDSEVSTAPAEAAENLEVCQPDSSP